MLRDLKSLFGRRRNARNSAILNTLAQRGPMTSLELGAVLGRRPGPMYTDLMRLEARDLVEVELTVETTETLTRTRRKWRLVEERCGD